MLVLEKDAIGGQITLTSEIVNYPGVLKRFWIWVDSKMRQYFGAHFEVCEVLSLDLDQTAKTIKTNNGDKKLLG